MRRDLRKCSVRRLYRSGGNSHRSSNCCCSAVKGVRCAVRSPDTSTIARLIPSNALSSNSALGLFACLPGWPAYSPFRVSSFSCSFLRTVQAMLMLLTDTPRTRTVTAYLPCLARRPYFPAQQTLHTLLLHELLRGRCQLLDRQPFLPLFPLVECRQLHACCLQTPVQLL